MRVIPIQKVETQGGCGGGGGDAADGWQRLSTLSEPRLSEMVANYKELGYEVEVRDIQRAEGSCNTCFDAGSEMGQVFGTLYVRRGADKAQDNELFE